MWRLVGLRPVLLPADLNRGRPTLQASGLLNVVWDPCICLITGVSMQSIIMGIENGYGCTVNGMLPVSVWRNSYDSPMAV